MTLLDLKTLSEEDLRTLEAQIAVERNRRNEDRLHRQDFVPLTEEELSMAKFGRGSGRIEMMMKYRARTQYPITLVRMVFESFREEP